MPSFYREAYALADRIESLREPYRQNAIAWLETCTQQPIENPRADILRFLSDLNPIVREDFVDYTFRILEEAVRYFGVPRGAASPINHAC